MTTGRLVLNLRGGLGNQLFGIYAAMALEAEFNVNCEIHTHGIDLNHKSGNSNATSFNFGRDLEFVEGVNLRQLTLDKLLNQKITKYVTFESKILKQFRYIENNDQVQTFLDLGDNFDSKWKKIHLDGFFQDFSYFNKVRQLLPEFILTESSNWLASHIEQAKLLQPIMIHVRLGDYLQNGMQILSKDYFNAALLDISRLVETDDVWVFSDSPDLAKEFLDLSTSKRVKFLANDQKSTETMVLMREGSGLICSNSTFSYWAGRTGTFKRPVLYPRKFSLNPNLQIRNIPTEWIPLDN